MTRCAGTHGGEEGSFPAGPKSGRYALSTVLSACLSIHAATAHAGQWRISPRLDVAETYTDNVTLAGAGRRQAEYITELAPQVTLRGAGRRLDLDLDYRLQGLYFGRDSTRNAVFHQLQSEMRAALLRDWLYLDGSATVAQRNIDPDAALALNNLAVTDNRTDVATFRLSPYLRHAFGRRLRAEARYAFARVDNRRRLADSDTDELLMALDIDRQEPLAWRLLAQGRRVRFDNGVAAEFASGEIGLRRALFPQGGITGAGGYEDNDFALAADRPRPRGRFWRAGAYWTPSPRTSLEGSLGERFYGRTYALSFSQRGRRTDWLLDYVEEATTAAQLQIGRKTLSEQGALLAATALGVSPALDTEVFIRQRLAVRYTREQKRGRLALGARLERRDFELAGRKETLHSGDLAWRRRLRPRLTAGVTGGWSVQDITAEGRANKLLYTGLEIAYAWSHRMTALGEYRHLKRTGATAAPSPDYDANTLSARLRIQW